MPIHSKRFRALAFVSLALAMNLRGEDATPRKEAVSAPKSAVASKLAAQTAVDSTTITEILGANFSVDPGKSAQFKSGSDFSGATRASVALYAPSDQDLSKTQILIWWAIPNALSYTVQDVISGANFPFLNTGGANVPVYGPLLLVEIRNQGGQTITLSQVTVYAVAR